MTKIDIISGFLGAGKTTFIKKMIEEVFKGEKIVLIENEFGEVGIDGGFLKDAGIEITEMNSGCICCSLVGDFGKNLHEVIEKFHPDRILIEPSGVGKLSDVMKSVIDVEKDEDVKLNGLITVVNALKASKQMKAFGEFFNNQIENAGTIVLSRTDVADPKKVQGAVEMLRQHNAKATIVTTPCSELTGAQLLEMIEQEDDMAEELMKEAREHMHEHHHHHHADEVFTSWGQETVKTFTKEQIEGILKKLSEDTAYGMVLRAKGMVAGADGQWIYFDMVPEEYEVRDGAPEFTGRICVIGSKLAEDKLAELFGL